jgi:cell wall-associated NlpC family hydrolase
MKRARPLRNIVIVLIPFMCIIAGCSAFSHHRPSVRDFRAHDISQVQNDAKPLPRMGFTIQVGAFSNVENAVELTKTLNRYDMEAYYFVYKKGLYKVRFGNFQSRMLAHKEAIMLQALGVINDFYIVTPHEYAIAREQKLGKIYLREELVRTAKSFIGVPYKWGGVSEEKGFDCSGLAMAVYKLNGLNLPRTSCQQYDAGVYVERDKLVKGDLVFFNTTGGKNVSHVGIYVGANRFIHAPGSGKVVKMSTLESRYFSRRYSGARKYF